MNARLSNLVYGLDTGSILVLQLGTLRWLPPFPPQKKKATSTVQHDEPSICCTASCHRRVKGNNVRDQLPLLDATKKEQRQLPRIFTVAGTNHLTSADMSAWSGGSCA